MIVPPGRSNCVPFVVERQVGHGEVVRHAARRTPSQSAYIAPMAQTSTK